MFAFARRCARRAFGIGCAIGLLVNLHLLPLVERAHAASLLPRTSPSICDPQPQLPQNLQDFIAIQCTVHSVLFGAGDNNDPATGYSMYGNVTTPGTYTGHDYLNRTITFDAVHVISADLKTEAPDLYTAGAELRMVAGTLAGPSGSLPVHGVVMLTAGMSPDTGPVLMVTATITTAQLDTWAVATRLQGGVRVVNSATGQSTPLSQLTGTPQLWGFVSDLSTLYCGCQADHGVDPACVRAAKDALDECVRNVVATASIAAAGAILLGYACLTGCETGAILTGPLAPFTAAACAAACWAGYAIAMAVIAATAAGQTASCYNQYKIALQACGVNITET